MSKPWKLLKTEKVFDSKYIKIGKNSVILPNGKEIDDYYTYIDNPDYITVIPIMTDGRILMINEWAFPVNQELLQFPEGYIDHNESPQQAAARELKEETGYIAKEVKIIGSCLHSHRRSTSRQYIALATGIEKIHSKDLKGLEHDIENIIFTKDEIKSKIASGDIIQRNVLSAWSIYWSKLKK